MIRLALVVLCGALAPLALADRSGALLEVSRFSKGTAKDVHAYGVQLATVTELQDEDPDAEDAEVQTKLKAARAKLAQLAGALGTETTVRHYVNGEQRRIDYTTGKVTRTVVVRLDVAEPYILVWDNQSKVAKKTLVSALPIEANKKVATNFNGMHGATVELRDRTCACYQPRGSGMGGNIFVCDAEDEDAMAMLQEFVETARDKLGGFKGELLWTTLDESQSMPMVGAIKTSKAGLRYDGTAGVQQFGWLLRRMSYHRKGDEPEWPLSLDPPKGYTIK